MSRRLRKILPGILLVTAMPCSSLAATGNVNVQVNIDGLSELILSANTAQWHHINYNPPGTTTINSSPWIPTGLSNFCNCYSDIFTGVNPPIPQNASNFDITKNDGRGAVTIVQIPSASNDYKLIVRFDDDSQGGSDDYDVLLTYQYPDIQPIPTLSEWAQILLALSLMGMAGWYWQRRAS